MFIEHEYEKNISLEAFKIVLFKVQMTVVVGFEFAKMSKWMGSEHSE